MNLGLAQASGVQVIIMFSKPRGQQDQTTTALPNSIIKRPPFQPRSVRVQLCHHQRGRGVMQLGAEVLLKLGSGFLAARISYP